MKSTAALVAAYLAIAPGPVNAADSITLDVGGIARTTTFYAPRAPHGDGAEMPRPLVIALHGLGGTGDTARRRLLFDPLAVRENFAVAYPDGIDKRWDYGRQLNRAMPQIDGKAVDDIAFLHAVIDKAVGEFNIDRKRVYLAGSSNGGLMAHRIACAMDQEIAAVAAYISGMTNWQAQSCKRERAVPILVLAGTDDTYQDYAGTSGNLNGYLLSVPNTVAIWRIRNGCRRGADEEDLSDLDPADGTTVHVIRYTECRDGADVLFYQVNGGGHQTPTRMSVDITPHPLIGRTNRDIETAEVTWDFFKRFRLP